MNPPQKKVLVDNQARIPEQDTKLIVYSYDVSMVITVRTRSLLASTLQKITFGKLKIVIKADNKN